MSGFAFKTFKQTVLLASALGIKSTEISLYTDKWVANIVLHAFITRNYELMNNMRCFTETNRVPLKMKQMLLYFLMKNSLLFSFSRWFYFRLKQFSSK